MVIDLGLASFLVAVALPVLVGVVTKEVTNGGVKATLLALFSAVAGALQSVLDNSGVLSTETLQLAVVTFIIAVATHFGFLKPTGIATAIQEKTDAKGIGW